MLKRLGVSLSVGMARESLALVRRSRWRGEAVTVLAERSLEAGAVDDPQRLLAALGQLLDGVPAKLPVRFVLADELVRLWQVTPPQGATRLADIEAACALRFQSLYGEPLAAWRLAADWDARAPFFAAAVPRPLADACEQAAQAAQLTVVEIVPQLVMSFNRWRKSLAAGAWFGMAHGAVLTIGVHDGRRLQAVRSLPLAPQADLAWLRAQLAREALRLNLAPPRQLQCCGQPPAAWFEDDGQGLACSRLDQARRGLPALSGGAMLAQSGGVA